MNELQKAAIRLRAVDTAVEILYTSTSTASFSAVDVARRYALGTATHEELVTAQANCRRAALERADRATQIGGPADLAALAAWATTLADVKDVSSFSRSVVS